MTLDRAILDGQPEGITARLVLTGDGRAEEIGCHPADAVALAVRRYAPLLGPPPPSRMLTPSAPPVRTSPLRAWLSRVRPADFRRGRGGGH